MGAEQIQTLAQARADLRQALDIVAADGEYDNAGFLRRVKGLRCGILARSPKVRGKAPGWPRGRPRILKQRYEVVKKTPVAAKAA